MAGLSELAQARGTIRRHGNTRRGRVGIRVCHVLMEPGIIDKMKLFAERMPTNGLAAGLPHREQTVAEVEAQPDAGYGMIGQSRSMIHSSYVHPRILYVIGQLGIGGYERQLYNLLQALDRPCYKPVV